MSSNMRRFRGPKKQNGFRRHCKISNWEKNLESKLSGTPELCNVLMKVFTKKDSSYLVDLVEYAHQQVQESENLSGYSPFVPLYLVEQSIIDLDENADSILEIRETGDIVALRIVIELLFQLGAVRTPSRNQSIKLKRGACTLVDALLLNIANPALKKEHIYLFTVALRSLLEGRKLPLPATPRMYQAEYLLNPHSRMHFLNIKNYTKNPNDLYDRQKCFYHIFTGEFVKEMD